jgi:soluble lytic murein transglycosylase
MKKAILLGSWLFLTTIGGAIADSTAELDSQRQDYAAALEALRAGDEARYHALYKKLDGYLLQGHAQYEYLKDRLDRTPVKIIQQFLADNAETSLPNMLRQRWLHVLADRGDWTAFEREYVDVPDDTELVCLHLAQRLKAGERTATVMDRIERLWLTGRRQPPACDQVYAAWKAAGHMTSDMVWERARLAMEAGNATLADDLARHLEPADRIWIERWKAMHRDPAGNLEDLTYPVETPVARMIVKHGIVRLAYREPEEAMRQWLRVKHQHEFFGEDEDYVMRYIAILGAQRHLPQALPWLASVSVHADDLSLMQWRIYAALRAGEWDTARRFIATLPEDEKKTARWRYWSARIADVGGDKRSARRIYTELAKERDYYGFLAADRINVEYSMQSMAIEAKPEELEAVLARPGMLTARELFTIGQVVEARRQWGYATRELNRRELELAAMIAREWGWYDRAIHAVTRSGYAHDLELRFPVVYRDVIESNAEQQGIDSGWVYGVVRQESAFVVDARSPAGAMGLMQLMPETGRRTLQRLKMRLPVHQVLLSVEHNVKLGVSHLKEVLQRYSGNHSLATAAYNAGAHRVDSWLPDGPLDADVWVETIPYTETRGYVKNVFAFAAVYDHRLGRNPTRLTTRMPALMQPAPDGS